MPSIIGVTLAKINGRFRVDVTNATWDVTRPVNQVPTGGGVRVSSSTLWLPVFGCDEIVPIGTMFDWSSLVDFSVQIYDQATQKQLLFSAAGFEWQKGSGTSDVASAMTKRKINALGGSVTKW